MNYVDNQRLYQELLDYHHKKRDCEERGLDFPEPSRYVTQCIIKMSENMSYRDNFIGYTYREDMVADAILVCVMYGLKSYNPEKHTNAFGYFSRIIWRAFVRRIELEKRQQYVKYKNYGRMVVDEQLDGVGVLPTEHTDQIDQFVSDYEIRMERKKQEKLDKAAEKESDADST